MLNAGVLIQQGRRVTGILLKVVPGSTAFGIELERAPDLAGAPNVGAAVDAAIFQPQPLTGTDYLDVMPIAAGQQWYRARHIANGYNPGNWTPWVAGTPVIVTAGQLQDTATPAVYPVIRSLPLTDGLYAVQAASSDGVQATRAVKIAGQLRTMVQMLTELVPNAEFDVWESTSQPHAWSVDATAGAVCAQESVAPFSGDYSLKYSNPDNASNSGWHGVATNDLTKGAFCVPLRAGLSYRVKIAAKTSRIAGGQEYRVKVSYNAAETLQQIQVFALGAVGVWQVDTFVLSVPAAAEANSKVYVEFSRNGDATATDFWVDSLRLTEDTPAASDLVAAASAAGANIVQNPDFESGVAYWRLTSGGSLDSTTSSPLAGSKSGTLLTTASITFRIQQCDRSSDLSGGQNPTAGNPLYVPVNGGDELFGSMAWGSGTSDLSSTWKLGVEEYDITKTLIQRTYLASHTALNTHPPPNGALAITGGAVLQATTAFIVVILELNAGSGYGGVTTLFDTVRVFRVSPPKNRVKALLSAVQSIANSTETTVSWGATDEFDVGSLHDPVGAPTKIVVPGIAVGIGAFHIHAQVQFASNATGYRRVRIKKNGATIIAEAEASAVNGDVTTVDCSVLEHRPASGDFYEVLVLQNSGGALNVVNGAGQSFFEAHQIL